LKKEILNSLKVLKLKGTLLYPTDTIWGIGCDATSERAVAQIFEIKQRSESKSLIILVDGIEMLQHYIPTISKNIIELLNSTIKPTTIVYSNPVGLAKNVIANDNSVAIRIVQNDFCKQLINAFGKPIVSTSANVSEQATPKSFKEIDTVILDSADYVVNLHREEVNDKSSTILKIADNGEILVIRE